MASSFDPYKVQRDFDEAHPQPERPKLPQVGQRTTPQVVMHRNGGLWLQMYEENESYRPESAYPAVELCITQEDKALKLRMSAGQFYILLDSAATIKAALESRVTQIEAWRDQLADYEQHVKERQAQREAYVETEEKAFKERQRHSNPPREKRG